MKRLIDLTHGFYAGMPAYPADWFPRFTFDRMMTPDTDPNGTTRTFSQLHLFPTTEPTSNIGCTSTRPGSRSTRSR